MRPEYFGFWNKWVIVSERLPDFMFERIRYDADIVLVKHAPSWSEDNNDNVLTREILYHVEDVYIHPSQSPSTYPWAYWIPSRGLQILYDIERLHRRLNLKRYALRIATPMGSYSKDTYNGSLKDYLTDMTLVERDGSIRSGYWGSALIIERLNATEVFIPTLLWSMETSNSSMTLLLKTANADLGGGVLRILRERVTRLDYAMPIWPFRIGFTYLAERESNNNMFAEPFTPLVWWSCFGLFVILAIAQRVTAESPMEKEGAYYAVLATCLQQDASAVPQGISGRWAFLVLSVSAMLIHAYYTSAIVSALMSAGRGDLETLRALGDSKYAIASEDYNYMRGYFFDVKTNWSDLEYLKQKKMTSKFYKDIHIGIKLIRDGSTAYHTEHNQLYPLMKDFTDDEICKVQHVDTVPETLTWITATRWGQFKNTFRIVGAWLHEVGIAKRIVSQLKIKPAPCRAALLAERVNIRDIAPLLIVTILGIAAAIVIFGLEVLVAKYKTKQIILSGDE